MSKSSAVFVAATRQHVGKTSTCLGLVSGLTKRFGRVGFIKPVGQEHVKAENVRVDKDVKLVREHFSLTHCRLEQMSPVVIPAGYTRKYLDKVDGFGDTEQLYKINSSFAAIRDSSDFVVVEGTGHVGVGSICNVSNAQVAAMLGVRTALRVRLLRSR
jgi:dethiobiotin synthetase